MVYSREGLMMASDVVQLLTDVLLQLQKSSLTLEMTAEFCAGMIEERRRQIARISEKTTKKVRFGAPASERSASESGEVLSTL